MSEAPRKIAILGGGMGGLVTAFYLSSQEGWREKFDITVHQIGWRLGGKCASSRGQNGRIEEHGIHGFLGSYYNALPMAVELFKELKRPAGTPMSTFEEALLPINFSMQWEWHDGALRPWPQRFPPNSRKPDDAASVYDFGQQVSQMLEWLHDHLQTQQARLPDEHAHLGERAQSLLDQVRPAIERDVESGARFAVDMVSTLWGPLRDAMLAVSDACEPLRTLFMGLDLVLGILRGCVDDDLPHQGFDSVDHINWDKWLLKHGVSPSTVVSPLAMTTVNITYNYPDGDTTVPSQMGAGTYARWTLRAFAYLGSFIWKFGAGTGETIVAPFYDVLKARGVKFEFFQKVTALRLSNDKESVAAVEIDVQARLRNPSAGYQPLIEVKTMPSWPRRPLYDQLVDEDAKALEAGDIDLESWWNGWKSPEQRVLKAGEDFDTLVFAISIGAVPHLCGELMSALPQWGDMVHKIPTAMTQAMQIWLSEGLYDLGWAYKLEPDELAISATYYYPQNGNGEFSDLIRYEDWPADNTPKGLWYFCGTMSGDGEPPPFTDTDYPRRMSDRVKYQSIQYLQTTIATMLPKATPNAHSPPGDPVSLDFSFLVDTRDQPAKGVARFDAQFWRANIDPTERYVCTPPGSGQYRLDAWASGFDNLVLAGDWIYTGLNVGSFEGATISGKLASYTISASPPLATIYGYPTRPKPGETWRPAGPFPYPPPPHEPLVT